MATKIRLARGGAKKRPFYRIVVADSRNPRDGRFIERIGSYSPLLGKEDPNRIILQEDRLKYWLSTGAEYSERIAFFIKAKNIDVTAIRKAGGQVTASAPKADAKPKAAKKPAAAAKAKKAS